MKYENNAKNVVWVYNHRTGSLTKKTLVFRVNDVESWFEEPKGWPTYDPFYIDENKDQLVERVHRQLSGELQENLSEVERLLGLIRKITRKV